MIVSKLQELVPLYINGAMSENDRRVFSQALKQNAILKQEYLEFYELDSLIGPSDNFDKQELERLFKSLDLKKSPPIPSKPSKPVKPVEPRQPSPPLTESQEIRKVERDLQEDYDDDYQPEKFSKEYFLYILSSPKVAWAIIGLQFVLLSLLAAIKFPHTLPSDSGASGDTQVMNVVFADTATQKDIRELLVDMNAQIANGPTDIGLYTIYIRNNTQQAELTIDRLKKSRYILLAEPAFAGKP